VDQQIKQLPAPLAARLEGRVDRVAGKVRDMDAAVGEQRRAHHRDPIGSRACWQMVSSRSSA